MHPGACVTVTPGNPLRGTVLVPGDKSISHRALLLNALAGGAAQVAGVLASEDVAATARALAAMGVELGREGDTWTITPPTQGWREPTDVLDCGNSGTSLRLLAGALAARPFFSVLTGDASLRRRPTARVVEPLRRMGAHLDGPAHGSRPPLAIRGGPLSDVSHRLPIASAQVKSALLLAGLTGGVRVHEPDRSRDHTERMLVAMGAALTSSADGTLDLRPSPALAPLSFTVPRDPSAAAFFLVAASIVPGSSLRLPGVGVNPTRSGVLDVLTAMGADWSHTPVDGFEPCADLEVRASGLAATHIRGPLALRSLDEIPILAVAAAFADGETVIADCAELRVKESDRIARVVAGLRALGVDCDERPDGLVVRGGAPRGPAVIDATGDHRIAMAFAVAGLAAPGGVTVVGADSVLSSFPGFFDTLESLR